MKKLLFGIFLTILPWGLALAVNVATLYQADVTVSTQASDERAKATKEGFLELLIKLTSDPQIDKNPLIQENLSRADYYVQDFNYALPSETSSNYKLHVRFNKEDVNRLLRKAGIPFWDENRPLLLTWLAVTNREYASEIVADGKPTTISGRMGFKMKQQSKIYGLPLIFPTMDMDDVSQVTPDIVNDMTLPVILAAAKRYAPDALLIGKMTERENGYESQWQLIFHDKKWTWTIADKSADNIIATIVNQVSQTLAKNYVAFKNAKAKADGVWVKLDISNVKQRDDLDQLIDYLKQIAAVKKVQVSHVSGDKAEISVLINGTVQAFQQNASVSQHLFLKSPDVSNNIIYYEWIP